MTTTRFNRLKNDDEICLPRRTASNVLLYRFDFLKLVPHNFALRFDAGFDLRAENDMLSVLEIGLYGEEALTANGPVV